MAQLNLNSYWKFDFLNHSHSLGCDGATTFSGENTDGRLPTLAIGQKTEVSLRHVFWERWTCSLDLGSSWFMGCDGSKNLFRNRVCTASARLFPISRRSQDARYILQVWTCVKCNEDVYFLFFCFIWLPFMDSPIPLSFNSNKTNRQKHTVSLKFDFFKGNFIIRSSLPDFSENGSKYSRHFFYRRKEPLCVSEVVYLPDPIQPWKWIFTGKSYSVFFFFLR